jgi:hypothetical protein
VQVRDIDAINFDLMYGLPEQTLADLDATLDETIRLAPSRIALFGYAHLPDMIPRASVGSTPAICPIINCASNRPSVDMSASLPRGISPSASIISRAPRIRSPLPSARGG